MSITMNFSSGSLASLDQLDASMLGGLTLQYAANLQQLTALPGSWTATQISSTLISYQQGTYSLSLAGTGIGPVSTVQALQDAVRNGLATGSFTSLTLSDGAIPILSMNFGTTGVTVSSGDVSLALTGNLPNSFDDLFTLAGLLQGAANIATLTPTERADLFTGFAAFDASAFSLSQGASEVLGWAATPTSETLTVDGFSLVANGTMPTDPGAWLDAAFQFNLAASTLLQDPDLRIYDSSGQLQNTYYYPEAYLDYSGLPGGRYYAEVTGYLGAQGKYDLDLWRATGGVDTQLTETTDAAAGTSTTYDLGSKGHFAGQITGADTSDWVAFDYVPGQGQILSAGPGQPDLSAITTLGLTSLRFLAPGGGEILAITSDGSLLDDVLQGDAAGMQVRVDGMAYDNVILPNSADGHSHDDVLYAGGRTYVEGGGGNDSIYGYNGENLLSGGAGDDRLENVSGSNSTLMGGLGNDRLIGNAETDRLYGGDGVDTLIGGGGDDFLFGGATSADLRDVIYGGDGNDYLDGGYGNDELRGDAGNDTLEGGFGADTVIGGTGNDVLTGAAWGDLLYGGDGNDFINGGFGYDRVNGGAGADKFYHLGVAGHGSDWIQDYNSAAGDVLMFGGGAAASDDFLVQRAFTPNAGQAGVREIFVTQVSTGNLLWALVDGDAQAQINIQIQGQVFDLLA